MLVLAALAAASEPKKTLAGRQVNMNTLSGLKQFPRPMQAHPEVTLHMNYFAAPEGKKKDDGSFCLIFPRGEPRPVPVPQVEVTPLEDEEYVTIECKKKKVDEEEAEAEEEEEFEILGESVTQLSDQEVEEQMSKEKEQKERERREEITKLGATISGKYYPSSKERAS